MTLLRRVSYGALALAFAHIVFGAIVRITGSGLGCGDHWPQCHGYWFPPFTRMDLVIEVMHRYLAFGLSVTIAGLLLLAFRRRQLPGVGGRGGVLRPIALASVLVVTAAVFGGVVVKLELRNKYVIVVHLAIAISTLASLAMAAIRAGGLGGAQALPGTASPRVWRSARAAAAMAFVAVVLGGLTAHVVGANGACVGFPLCSRGIPTPGAPLHIHLTHRFVAFALFFHLLGMVMMVRKRRESPLIQWATRIAFGTVVLQILVAAALVELHLPPVLRSLHQAVGTLVWLSIFVLAALARRGSRDAGDGALLVAEPPRVAPEPGALPRGAATANTVVASVAASAVVVPQLIVAGAEAPAVEERAPEAIVATAVVEELVVEELVVEAPVVAAAIAVAPDEAGLGNVGEVFNAAVAGDAEAAGGRVADPGFAEAEVLEAEVLEVEAVEAEAVAAEAIEGDAREVEAGDVNELVERVAVAEKLEPVAATAVETHVEEPAPVVEADEVQAQEVVAAVEATADAPVVEAAADVEDEPAVDRVDADIETVDEADDFDREVAARLEAVVGRDPFDDDDQEELDEEEAELDADDDLAAVIAAQFAGADEDVLDEGESPLELEAARPVALEGQEPAPAVAAVEEPAPAVAAEAPVAIAAVAADVAVLPAAPRRPPTLAVLIARGADF